MVGAAHDQCAMLAIQPGLRALIEELRRGSSYLIVLSASQFCDVVDFEK